ncbi:MAG: betaine--homocysteine S-methyltransferase, partial [Pseudomonadota bacterium]
MTTMLHTLLSTHRTLLADGATGTNLFDMGLTTGDAPELWTLEQPEKIKSLHRSFVEAGADIILTNTFGCNARRLMLHDAQDQTHTLNAKAADLARAVVAETTRDVCVAGSVGPTGDLFAPLGPLTMEDAIEVFAAQVEGLKAGGVDVIWIETMSAPEEMEAAARAAASAGMAYTLTGSFDTAGRTMMGTAPDAFVAFAAGLDPQPLAIGANCGVGASDLLGSVLGFSATGTPLTLIAKANCGIPTVH